MRVDEGVPVRSAGGTTREYVEMRSDKEGENPSRRKSKGSWAR